MIVRSFVRNLAAGTVIRDPRGSLAVVGNVYPDVDDSGVPLHVVIVRGSGRELLYGEDECVDTIIVDDE